MDYYTLTLEDLLGGAFTTMDLQNNRFVAYKDLDEYANRIIKYLEKEGIHCRLQWGRNETSCVLYYYADYFEEVPINGIVGIMLKTNITKEQIARKFTCYLPLKMLLALRDKSCIEVFESARGAMESATDF